MPVILIGATTHNPFHAINSALLSRSQIFQFKALTRDQIRTILRRALADGERGLGQYGVTADDDALDLLAEACDGDARRALNALEVGVLSSPPGADGSVHFDIALAEASIQRKAILYDRDEDEHYDTASAFISAPRLVGAKSRRQNATWGKSTRSTPMNTPSCDPPLNRVYAL